MITIDITDRKSPGSPGWWYYASRAEFDEHMRKVMEIRNPPTGRRTNSLDALHRIVSGAPITPREVRLAGYFALGWFLMDTVWFICTWTHSFGF